MFLRLKNKIKIRYKRNPLRLDGLKICFLYFLIGFFWIYFSDRILSYLFEDKKTMQILNTYKGIFYVLLTALLLYYLILKMLKKVDAAEKKLMESYDELSAANEELQAYVQQLTASEEELRNQYDQIVEYDTMLRASEEKYKALVNQMQLGLALYEGNSDDIMHFKLIDTNDSHEILTGFKKDEIMGKYFHEIHKNMEADNMDKLYHTVKTGEPTRYERYQIQTSYYYEVIAYRPKKNQLAIIVNDITKRKQAEDRLQHLSYHDQLTQLYNRRYFEEELVRLDRKEYYPLMITIADINGLKLINDSFGHSIGDEYIKRVAKVLLKGVRKKDIVCRLAGDEFIILSPNTELETIKNIVSHIKELARNESINSVDISISFGYGAKYSEEESVIDVFKRAEDFMYKKKLVESPSMRGKTIYTIMAALHEKNPREEQHSHRVSELCEKMGLALDLQEDEIKELRTVGMLHDIGKVAIEEGILNKNDKLNENEWEEIKRHPEIGYRILSTVNELSEMAEYVLAHHERWDGRGYPKGLKGEEIPIQSRIIAIADAYDAMISERSYRKALSKEYAINELKQGAGSQFCPYCVNVMIENVLNKEGEGPISTKPS
ncbi:MAG: diguanylate cyclase [Candidatus Galacturonibacter soehngenii]|nr:diguanylate cyclase [Candidatus Galacturonibacter soehngenii]